MFDYQFRPIDKWPGSQTSTHKTQPKEPTDMSHASLIKRLKTDEQPAPRCYWFGDEDGGDFIWVRSDEELEQHRDNWQSDGYRCEWADGFHGKSIPANLQLSNGFCLACDHCQRMLADYGPFDDEYEAEPITDGPWVWCNQSCRDSWQAEKDRLRAFREATERRFTFATNVRAYHGSPGKCSCYSKDRDCIAADIKFPGGKYDAQLCGHCRKLWVSACDAEIWQELVSGHRFVDENGRAIAQGAD